MKIEIGVGRGAVGVGMGTDVDVVEPMEGEEEEDEGDCGSSVASYDTAHTTGSQPGACDATASCDTATAAGATAADEDGQWETVGVSKLGKKRQPHLHLRPGGAAKPVVSAVKEKQLGLAKQERIVEQLRAKLHLDERDGVKLLFMIKSQHNGTLRGLTLADILAEGKDLWDRLSFRTTDGKRVTERYNSFKFIDEAQLSKKDKDLLKTKVSVCNYYLINSCTKGSQCPFAHGDVDMSPLLKKYLCAKHFLQNGCSYGDRCVHVHEYSQLKGDLRLPLKLHPSGSGIPGLNPVPATAAAAAATTSHNPSTADSNAASTLHPAASGPRAAQLPEMTLHEKLARNNQVKLLQQQQRLQQQHKPRGREPSTGSVQDEECCICHEDMHSLRVYEAPCGHMFHDTCIKQWTNKNRSCPICRTLLVPEDEFPPLK